MAFKKQEGMQEIGKKANNATVLELGIRNSIVHWNLSPEKLSQIAIEKNQAKKKEIHIALKKFSPDFNKHTHFFFVCGGLIFSGTFHLTYIRLQF